jgi:hypothetical protein
MNWAPLVALALITACSAGSRAPLAPVQLPQRAGVDPIVGARAAGVAYRAVGAAPDFVLHIYREDRIVLAWDSGAHEETFPKPAPILPRWNGEIYETHNDAHTLWVEIHHTPCASATDEMSVDTVRVVIDGEERNGCGRSL